MGKYIFYISDVSGVEFTYIYGCNLYLIEFFIGGMSVRFVILTCGLYVFV